MIDKLIFPLFLNLLLLAIVLLFLFKRVKKSKDEKKSFVIAIVIGTTLGHLISYLLEITNVWP